MAYMSYAAVVFPILVGIYFVFRKPLSSPSHDALPIIGVPPHIFGRLAAAIRYILHADDFFKEGYRKHPSGFRVPELFSRYLIVLPTSLTEELKSAAETDLSQARALEVEVVMDKLLYTTLGMTQPFHVPILRGTLTHRLGDLLGGLEEETILAFEEEWSPDIYGWEWTEINAYKMGKKITSRSNHRIVVGLPLCRNKEFNSLYQNYVMGAAIAGCALRSFPCWVRNILAPILTYPNWRNVVAIRRLLDPVVDETERLINHNLDPANAKNQIPEPQRILTWVVKESHKVGPPVNSHKEIALRMLMIDTASNHSLSTAFANALINLASFNPPSFPGKTYQEVLREELIAVANSDGDPEKWTRRKYQLLTGMDSFIKEGLRLHAGLSATLLRMVTRKGGYNFSNGLHVPEGANVCIPGHRVMRDDAIYPNADEFDGFRHQFPYHLIGQKKVDPTMSMSTTGAEYLPFGYGVHACPGRFFASILLKVSVRHFLEKFDVEVVGKGRVEPPRIWNLPIGPISDLVRIRRRVA